MAELLTLTLTITATDVLTKIDGVPVRLWEGVTVDGVPCRVFVHRVVVRENADTTAFEGVLRENRRRTEMLHYH